MEWNKYQKDKVEYINKSSEALDKAVHGLEKLKLKLKELLHNGLMESTGQFSD